MMNHPFTGERFWANGDATWHCRNGETRRLHARTDRELASAILHQHRRSEDAATLMPELSA